MTVRVIPPHGAPAAVIQDIRAVAFRHPGDHALRLQVGEHGITYGERVDVCKELVVELEDLDLTVEITA